MTENEIAKIVVDGAYHIHRRLGPGLLPIDCRFSAALRLCVRPFFFSPGRRLYEPGAGLSGWVLR